MLKQSVRNLVDNELAPIAAQLDKESKYPAEQVAMFSDYL